MKNKFARIILSTIAFALMLVISPNSVSASVTGVTSGTIFSNINNAGQNWANSSNAQNSDDTYATVNLTSTLVTRSSDFLQARAFGFSIPSNATITGIEVVVEKSATASSTIRTQSIELVRPSNSSSAIYTATTSSPFDWTPTDTVDTYGSSTSIVGVWTPTDINSANFRVRLAARHSNPGVNSTARVDQVTVNVYYTALPVISLSSNVSTSTLTNQDIIVSATSTNSSTLNALSNTFITNGSFSFVATNIDGTATSTVTITNIDKEAPILATSTDIMSVEATSPSGAVVTYTNPTATDNNPGSTVSCIASSGSTFALGMTPVICNASDVAGNNATSTTFNIQVVDTTAPVIALTGSSTIAVQAGTVFVDLGAIANDASGNFAASSTNNVNTAVLGSYTVTYTATDASGNIATSTTRTVNVVDTTAPVAPTAVSPSANSIFKTSNLTTFDWNDVSDFSSPVTYGYQLSTSVTTNPNGSFSFPTTTGNLLSLSEATIASSSIANEGNYYYIARAIDALGNTGAWMAPVQFTIDNTAPVIALTGSSTLTVEGGSVYTDAGATGTDNLDVSVTVLTAGTVNTTVLGSTTLSYGATDTAGNNATPVTRVVTVVDTTSPVIALTGSSTITLEAGSVYTELGVTVSDNLPNPITATATGTVSTFVVGTYTVTYNAVDGSGNAATPVTRTINVIDTTAPVINITGQNPNIVTINNTYVDSGATAADLIDGVITVTSTSTVNTAVLGNYSVTYSATDLSNNTATSSRMVIVIPPDTTAPVITLIGSTPITLEGGLSYTDAGATALDNVNGNLTSSIATINSVNNMVVGAYTVTYNVADGAGNAAIQGVRTVNVVDTTAPVITLVGASILTLHTGDVYTELGATTTDAVDHAVSVIVGGDTVTTTATSTFTVTYNAIDASGNAATQVTRTVHVVDIAVPIITVVGSSTITLEHGTSYTDAGATAMDDVDGDISANIIATGSVNTLALGTYTITYNVTDSSLNAAMPAVRTVNVVDTTAPVIEVNGSSTISLIVGDVYTELGASSTDAVDGILTVTTTGSVATSTIGTYNLLYTATDLSGNTATTSRTVIVSAAPDTIAPIITILGLNPVSVTIGTSYTDAGATTTDNVDLSVPVTASSTVNISTIGTYTVTYSATDIAGNVAIPVVRIVNVIAAPVVPAITGGGSFSGGGGFAPFLTTQSATTLGAATTTATSTGRVLGISTFKFDKNLRVGMKNNDVIELQKVLSSFGFLKTSPTGYFGTATLNAVKAYQKSKGIPTTGFVGVLTRAELNK